ncbi:hypothetical protein KGM_205962A, partial [Danaus plexippus plexippus]
MWFDQ